MTVKDKLSQHNNEDRSKMDFIFKNVNQKDRTVIKNELDSALNAFHEALIFYEIRDPELLQDMDSLQESLYQMMSISKQYEFLDLAATGYITVCVMVRDFLRHILQRNYLKYPKSVTHLKIMIRGFLTIKNLLLHFHENQCKHAAGKNFNPTINESDSKPSLPLFSHGVKETVHHLDIFLEVKKFQETLHTEFPSFWVGKNAARVGDFYRLSSSMSYKGFLFSPHYLFNRKNRCRTFVKLSSKANMKMPYDSAFIVDTHFFRKLCANVFFKHSQVVAHNIWIPAQGRWTILNDGYSLKENRPPVGDDKMIRCRIFKHRTKVQNDEGIVLFHLHGSGFIVSRPEIHDVYLNSWTADLNGVPIVSVDYSLRTKFPQQFQDGLDAYLWLTSGKREVEEELGFKPKKIVIAGDSAGGLIGMVVLQKINEIRQRSTDVAIMLPDASVNFYSVFWITGEWSPSKTMGLFDPLLHYGNIMAIAGCVSGISGNKKGLKPRPKNRLVKASRYLMEDLKAIKRASFPRRGEAFYIKDGSINHKAIEELYRILNIPSTSIPKYPYLDDFKEMSLYLVTTFNCIFLDDNIEMAKAWKGPVEVHVMENQPHGFLFMPFEKKSQDFARRVICQAVEKCRQSCHVNLEKDNFCERL